MRDWDEFRRQAALRIKEAMRESTESPPIKRAPMKPAPKRPVGEPKIAGPESNLDLHVMTSEELVKGFAGKALPWIQEPFLLRGEVTLVVGAANLGKSTFVLQMAWRGATGLPWFLSKKRGSTFRTLYISLEAGEHPLSVRVNQMFGGGHANLVTSTPPMLALNDNTLDAIGAVVRERKIDVVVIDNLLGMEVGVDLNKMEGPGRLMNDARAFAQVYDVALVLVHHTRKGSNAVMSQVTQFDADMVLDEASGSKVLVNRAGIRLFLRKRGNARRLFVYSRFGPQRTIRLGWDKTRHVWKRSSREEETGESQEDVEDEVNDGTLEEPRMEHAPEGTNDAGPMIQDRDGTNDTKPTLTPYGRVSNIGSYHRTQEEVLGEHHEEALKVKALLDQRRKATKAAIERLREAAHGSGKDQPGGLP